MKFVEITAEHVNKSLFTAFGQTWPVSGFIGRVLPQDVGKRVYYVGGCLEVESDAQRAARLVRGAL